MHWSCSRCLTASRPASTPSEPIVAHPSLQFEQAIEKDNSHRLLVDICAVLFATSSQMQRLSMSTGHAKPAWSNYYLPSKICSLVSMVSSLERLTLNIEEPCNFRTLAESVHSLQKLKVRGVALQPCIGLDLH